MLKSRRSQNDGKSYRDTCNKIPSGLAHLRPSGETLSHGCIDRSLSFRGFGRPESELAREGLLLGIAPSQRWVDPKVERRFNEDTKHQRSRQGPASEGDALNLRDASGSAKATDEKGEVPRSLLKVVTEGL